MAEPRRNRNPSKVIAQVTLSLSKKAPKKSD